MSNNTNNGRNAETRRILIALAVSLLLHLAVLWQLDMLPSARPIDTQRQLAGQPDRCGNFAGARRAAGRFVAEGLPSVQAIEASTATRVDAPRVPKSLRSQRSLPSPPPRLPTNTGGTPNGSVDRASPPG